MLNNRPHKDWQMNQSLINHVPTENAPDPFRQISAY